MPVQTKQKGKSKSVRQRKSVNKKTAASSGQGFWFIELFTETYFGRVIIGIAIITIVIMITLLAVKNRYELFFLILGIETVIACAAGWLIYLLRHDADSDRDHKK